MNKNRRLRFTRKHIWFALILTIVWLGGSFYWNHNDGPDASSRIVVANATNFQSEMQVMSGDHPKSVLLYVCTGNICDTQQATMNQIADMYADRLKVIQVTPEGLPELIEPISNIVAQQIGVVAYPMYVLMTPDQSTNATAGMLNVAQLSRFINSFIGSTEPDTASTDPGTTTQPAPAVPQLQHVRTLTQENSEDLMQEASTKTAVYTLWCSSSDPLCIAQLSALDEAAASHPEILFVWIDSGANLGAFAQMSQQLMNGRMATPAHVISTSRGALPLIGFLDPESIDAAINMALDPTAGTGNTAPTPTPDATDSGSR